MTIIGLIVTLVIVGVALYFVNSLLPIDPKVKTILNVVVVLTLCLWLLDTFVGIGTLGSPILRR